MSCLDVVYCTYMYVYFNSVNEITTHTGLYHWNFTYWVKAIHTGKPVHLAVHNFALRFLCKYLQPKLDACYNLQIYKLSNSTIRAVSNVHLHLLTPATSLQLFSSRIASGLPQSEHPKRTFLQWSLLLLNEYSNYGLSCWPFATLFAWAIAWQFLVHLTCA